MMAKSEALILLAVTVFAAQSAVLPNEDIQHQRIARSPCDVCGNGRLYGPPPPPPFGLPPPPFGPPPPPFGPPLRPPHPHPPRMFQAQQWTGITKGADGSPQGVYSGAAATTSTGQKTNGEAFSLASSGVDSGSDLQSNLGQHDGSVSSASAAAAAAAANGGSGYDQQFESGNNAGSNTGVNGGSRGSDHVGGLSPERGDIGDDQQQLQSNDGSSSYSSSRSSSGNGFGSQGFGNQGFGSQDSSKYGHYSSGNHEFGSQVSSSEGFKGQSAGNHGSGSQVSGDLARQGSQEFESHGFHGQGYGSQGNGNQKQSETSKLSNSIDKGSYDSPSQYRGSNIEQQQQSNELSNGQWQQEGYGSAAANSRHAVDDTQTALKGALDLSSQGLETSKKAECSTCGKSNYAFSKAKSNSGSAIAVSVSG